MLYNDNLMEKGAHVGGMSAKKKSTVQPIEVQNILNGGSGGTAASTPVEHLASPTSSTHSIRSIPSHGRAQSIAESTISSRTNRFSTSFPVQPASSITTSPTRFASPTREGTAVVPETLASPTGPSDTTYLTAIAAQERKVLELKEELQRAEADLNKLKKQWTEHEANKKRNDARRVTKLQPLQTSPRSSVDKEDDVDGSSAWMQQEMERRKALMNGGKSSNRTVFSGSRHTRTLSLLSPAQDDTAAARPTPRRPLPQRKDSLYRVSKRSTDSDRPATRPAMIARASTTPDLTTEIARSADPGIDLPDNLDKGQQGQIDSEALIKHGKKMATDLKDGLWTFLEDLRQATVGDEATQHQTVLPAAKAGMPAKVVRKKDSTQTIRSGRTHLQPTAAVKDRGVKTPSPVRKHTKSATQGALPDLANPGFWSEHGVPTPAPVQTIKKSPTIRGNHTKTPLKAHSIASTDAWDTWDESGSPKDSTKDSRSSSAASEAATLPSTVSGSGPTSPRPSGGGEKKEPIPWPALRKFGPGTLKRTASKLMSEWEKSLTPSPGKEFAGQEDYLGCGAEAAAMGLGRKKEGR